jgi:O-antigen ligase
VTTAPTQHATQGPTRALTLTDRLGLWLERGALSVLLSAAAFAPLVMGGVYPWGLFGIRLLVLASTVLWLLAIGAGRPLRLPRPAVFLALLAYLAVLLVSTLLSAYPYSSLQASLNILIYALAFMLGCGLIATASRRKASIGVMVAVAVIMGGYGLLQFFGLRFTPMLSPARLSSFYYNSNHYSGYLALVVPLTAALMLYSKRSWLQIGYGLLFVLLMFNLALTFSWGLLATCIALLGLFVVWAIRQPNSRFLVRALSSAVLIGALSLGSLVAFTPQLNEGGVRARLTEFRDVWMERSFLARVAIGEASLKIVGEHPVLGVGPGNFIYEFTEHRTQEVSNAADQVMHRFVNYAHNDYSQVASESGLLGLAAFLTFWFLVLKLPRPITRPGLELGLLVGLVALMVHGLTDGNMTVIPANVLLAHFIAGAVHAPVTAAAVARNSHTSHLVTHHAEHTF